MRQLLTLLLLLLISIPISGEDLKVLFQKGDAAYAKRDDSAKAQQALEIFRKALAQDPKNEEAIWKTARATWWVGDTSLERKIKLERFQEGMDLAEKGVELYPKSAALRFWLGANMGSYGEAKGILKSLFLLKPIKKEMNALIQIDPSYEGGGAHRVLGIVDYKVPRLAGGNKKRSLERLTKALSFDEKNPFSHYYLAEYYSIVKNKEKVKEHIIKLNSLTSPTVDAVDHLFMRRKGQALAEKLNLSFN